MPQGVLNQRVSGIVLHPTSLPGNQVHGSFGKHAYRWIDWLCDAGIRVWQTLPLCPVADGSPYNSYSAFAGNPLFIDIEQLQHQGFPNTITERFSEGKDTSENAHFIALSECFRWLMSSQHSELYQHYCHFIETTQWLDDACIFMVLKQQHPQHWIQWPQALKQRDSNSLAEFRKQHQTDIALQKFIQFVFDLQWRALKQYANDRAILIFGDLPIFVSHDSADVWANRGLYKLNDDGKPQVIAGVPPDYFSSTGQRWGNPIYHWPAHQQDQFSWWRKRINHSLTLYDAVRIDHFRGFVGCWEIPADEPTAINGQWTQSPGDELFQALLKECGELPLIAEDLGIITEEVIALRKKYGLPGMKILQFAFDSDGNNPYLPHNHTRDSVIYSGTHDNNTTVGWYNHLDAGVKERIKQYFSWPEEPMPWPILKSALASPARWAMLPFQDLLELGEEHRMNTPGTIVNNWQWRFTWEQVSAQLAPKMKTLNQLYNR